MTCADAPRGVGSDPEEGCGDWPDLVVCPGGPLLVRGDHVIEDADGRRHRTERPVSAVCRCGRTGTAPWCDGTHQQLPRKQRP